MSMKSRVQLKRFPSPVSVGNRVLDRLLIKPALNPHSATGRIERQRDRVTANQRNGQIIRERERDRQRQRGRDENSFTYTAATSLLNFSNQYFVPELVSFADIIRKITSCNLLFIKIV